MQRMQQHNAVAFFVQNKKKKFRHACILCRGGKQPCLPLQPRWCHLRPHFLTGLEDLAINVLPALPPIHHLIPAPASLSFPSWRIAASPTFSLSSTNPSANHRDLCQTFFYYYYYYYFGIFRSGEKKHTVLRTWKWWRRKSEPCSRSWMMRKSESWPFKESWTLRWNSAKKWEKFHYSR